jgi:hypothetical protein
MTAVRLLAAGLLAALALGAGAVGAAPGSTSCSIRGLASAGRGAHGLRVVFVHAHGVSCSTARSVAVKVAHAVATGGMISIPGSVGLGMTQSSCTGCKTTTQVSITFPRGMVTVGLTAATGAPGAQPSGGSPGPVI